MASAFDELRDQLASELDQLRQRRRLAKSLGTPRVHTRPTRPMPELLSEMKALTTAFDHAAEKVGTLHKSFRRPSMEDMRAAFDAFRFKVEKAYTGGHLTADQVARLEARRIRLSDDLAAAGLI